MEIKTLEEELEQVLGCPNDSEKTKAYIDHFVALLEEKKITEDTANLAIKGFDVDLGANMLDAFSSLKKENVPDAWKAFRGCKEFKKNTENKATKMVCAFAGSALSGEANATFVVGNILTAVVSTIKGSKNEENGSEGLKIVLEYLLSTISKGAGLPEWKAIQMTPEYALEFCDIVSNSINLLKTEEREEKVPSVIEIEIWISKLKHQAGEAKELKDREKEKTPKKSEELAKLVEHFSALEQKLDSAMVTNAKLSTENHNYQDEICKLKENARELERKINDMESENSRLNIALQEAKLEVDERKKLNIAQVQYREDTQESLLKDIARALKAEYGDYVETKDQPMDEMLGEIYREKLNHVFRILEQKGVKVEE